MPPTPDQPQRELALDITKSCIVQAPAGSGKTTLLVQRFLKLLAQVNYPENIVALTFTRKAATEMRERILQALTNPQDTTLRHLSQQVLQQDQKLHWNLLKNPQRLRIQTIDSLCHYLSQQLPIVSRFNAFATLAENAVSETCYREATQALLNNNEQPTHLKTLLLYLNNDWQRLENLCCEMLAKRDQWLPHLVSNKDLSPFLRQVLETALTNITRENVEKCQALLPQELRHELAHLIHFAQCNLQAIDFKQDFFCMDLESDTHWRQAAQLLLTEKFTWRARVTKEHGFPSTEKAMKARMHALLEKFQQHENFRQSLEDLLLAPPTTFSDHQWEIVHALLAILPLLAAYLKVVFKEKNLCDYIEVAMAALEALGDAENPSELALNLDYRIQHLLVDEFQDTSYSQYRLIEKLIAGWQPDDGHTLFLVGDPMQSIYRFREAEVGLFLRTLHTGIGNLTLQPVTLTTNFRSTQGIISWVNTNFAKVLPGIADISFGAVPFHPSVANNQDKTPAVIPKLLVNANTTQEAEQIITIIRDIMLQAPQDSIAVLVKSRSHLAALLPLLRQANLAYQGVDLDTLSTAPIIQDLFSLTRAVLDPGDRVAWLSILRAPWCCLTLCDLYLIANGPHALIWDNIDNYTALNLSSDAQQRVNKVRTVIKQHLQHRGRRNLRDAITIIWRELQGPACLQDATELENAKKYFALLEQEDLTVDRLEQEINTLYADTTAKSNLQIMTIHKAKGLEFDHVIIPGMDRATKADTKKLLLWTERPRLHGGSDLLLAPISTAADPDAEALYRYLQLIAQRKNYYETGRLLYVAITRAKKSVYLLAKVNHVKENSLKIKSLQKGCLLEQLNPCIDSSWFITPPETATAAADKKLINRVKSLLLTTVVSSKDLTPAVAMPPAAADSATAIIGSVIHKILAVIATQGLNQWPLEKLATKTAYFQKLLRQFGSVDVVNDLAVVTQAITNSLTDPQGRWILDQHPEAHSEYAISTVVNSQLEHYIIDRIFIDNDVLWIIDFKTSEIMVAAQQAQLQKYAKIMRQLKPNLPIKLGLYFPLQPKLYVY